MLALGFKSETDVFVCLLVGPNLSTHRSSVPPVAFDGCWQVFIRTSGNMLHTVSSAFERTATASEGKTVGWPNLPLLFLLRNNTTFSSPL
jgi:hypothetical protein